MRPLQEDETEASRAEGKWGQRDESKMERTAASFSFR